MTSFLIDVFGSLRICGIRDLFSKKMSLTSKEKKKLLDRKRSKTRINIGDCFEEWRALMRDRGLSNDRLLCRHQLDM